MHIILAVAFVLLPITAFAQSIEGPDVPIPVQKCVQTRAGLMCTPVTNGDGFAAADGYQRVYRSGTAAPSRDAMVMPRSAEPLITR